MFKKLVASAVLVIASIVPISTTARAASDFSECKNDEYDGYTVIPSFNITSVCVVLSSDYGRSDEITFFLYFQTPPSRYMFTSSGSWAGIFIDTNADGINDIEIQTTGRAYPADTGSVAAAIYVGDTRSQCAAETWANTAANRNYIAFTFSRTCIGLAPSNIRVQGYADYIANDGKWYDYAPEGGWWLDFYQWTLQHPGTTTTPTTPTTVATTIPAVVVPNSPSSLSTSRISDTAFRVSWLDNSTNEDGFLLQRDDALVAEDTTVTLWPNKVSSGVISWDVTALTQGKRYCITVAAFNSSGVSKWADWSCIELLASIVVSGPVRSLSCDASRGKIKGAKYTLVVSTGTTNAGRKLNLEAFVKGKWSKIGSGRVNAIGNVKIVAKSTIIGRSGRVPLRATQGSRFICEGNISG